MEGVIQFTELKFITVQINQSSRKQLGSTKEIAVHQQIVSALHRQITCSLLSLCEEEPDEYEHDSVQLCN